ncbi:MAG: 16S rRNA (guanine(527)-N(7))-methyltransferase RsmG [Candidatus Promineifilaceae bacterium]|nr:16S rRNA (guanine(527)-N(7))-methyltransferase RsmG [Candidatus Promineifilaceae bacterium]
MSQRDDDLVAPLAEEAAAFGLTLNAAQLARFADYLGLLQAWNQRLSLTAITDPEEIRIRHFLDSLSCAVVTGDLNGRRLVDVGSGAGFPGLPLKILFPELALTLVESVAKKALFLETVIDELGLGRVMVLNERAETIGARSHQRERYDWAVARAVAHLSVLAEYLLPLVRVGGHLLAQKGPHVEEEIKVAKGAISKLGGGAVSVHTVQLPAREQTHTLIVAPKVAPTPPAYPRRPGRPAKRPLR